MAKAGSRLTAVRKFALSLPETSEEPHFDSASFRVRGKIFVTVPPDGQHLHLFVTEEVREQALALHPDCLEKLWWGKSVRGLRARLEAASLEVLKPLVRAAWECKAPKTLPGKP
jgi:hypothetical protein